MPHLLMWLKVLNLHLNSQYRSNMFRSLVTIISEIYMYLTEVIFVKTLEKITSLYKLGDVAACRRAACVLCAVLSETGV